MAGVLLRLLDGEDGGQLNPADLWTVAAALTSLGADLGALVLTWNGGAVELDRTVDTSTRV